MKLNAPGREQGPSDICRACHDHHHGLGLSSEAAPPGALDSRESGKFVDDGSAVGEKGEARNMGDAFPERNTERDSPILL